MGEGPKIQFGSQPANFKIETPEELDGNIKNKKVKTNKNGEIHRAFEPSSKNKGNIKNTYINKIKSLITDPSYAGQNEGTK